MAGRELELEYFAKLAEFSKVNLLTDDDLINMIMNKATEVFSTSSSPSLYDIIVDNNYATSGMGISSTIRALRTKITFDGFVYDLFVMGRPTSGTLDFTIRKVGMSRDLTMTLFGGKGDPLKPWRGFYIQGNSGNTRLITISTKTLNAAAYNHLNRLYRILNE